MTQIFVIHSEQDAPCAQQISQGLEAAGYGVWRQTPDVGPDSISYPRLVENGILGSAAAVLVWSVNAAQAPWVERELLFAQRLTKPIVPTAIDGTPLPATLVGVEPIASQPPCADAAAKLLPHLPPPQADGAVTVVREQLSHEYIRVRKQAIERSVELLESDEHRQELLAALDHIARKDLIIIVREAAQAVLDAQAKAMPAPADESRHIFGVRCAWCGSVTYFDKRKVCPASGTIERKVVDAAGKELDELYLKCEHCGEQMQARVDCEGYK